MSCCWGEDDAPTVPPSPPPLRRGAQTPHAVPAAPATPQPQPVQREHHSGTSRVVRHINRPMSPQSLKTQTPYVAVTPPRTEVSFSRKPLPPGCLRFSYLELCGATGNFAENAVLGEGGFGKVYRGTLEDGRPVAIKRLDRLGLQVNLPFLLASSCH